MFLLLLLWNLCPWRTEREKAWGRFAPVAGRRTCHAATPMPPAEHVATKRITSQQETKVGRIVVPVPADDARAIRNSNGDVRISRIVLLVLFRKQAGGVHNKNTACYNLSNVQDLGGRSWKICLLVIRHVKDPGDSGAQRLNSSTRRASSFIT